MRRIALQPDNPGDNPTSQQLWDFGRLNVQKAGKGEVSGCEESISLYFCRTEAARILSSKELYPSTFPCHWRLLQANCSCHLCERKLHCLAPNMRDSSGIENSHLALQKEQHVPSPPVPLSSSHFTSMRYLTPPPNSSQRCFCDHVLPTMGCMSFRIRALKVRMYAFETIILAP